MRIFSSPSVSAAPPSCEGRSSCRFGREAAPLSGFLPSRRMGVEGCDAGLEALRAAETVRRSGCAARCTGCVCGSCAACAVSAVSRAGASPAGAGFLSSSRGSDETRRTGRFQGSPSWRPGVASCSCSVRDAPQRGHFSCPSANSTQQFLQIIRILPVYSIRLSDS